MLFICTTLLLTQLSSIPFSHLFLSGYQDCHVYVQTDSPAEYMVDEAKVVLIPDDADWKSKAQQRIEQNRKADIKVV